MTKCIYIILEPILSLYRLHFAPVECRTLQPENGVIVRSEDLHQISSDFSSWGWGNMHSMPQGAILVS